MRRFQFLFAGALALGVPRPAAPQSEADAPMLAALRGQLQVRADQTSWNAKTGRISLRGAVAVSGADPGGRRSTWLGEDARVAGARSEFQITDNVAAEFADGSAVVNRALSDGHIAGYAEAQLLSALREHPGFGRYRLHYRGVGAGASTNGDLLFDRAKQKLIINETFVYPAAKLNNKDRRIYSDVTEKVLTAAIVGSRDRNSTKRLSNIVDFGAQLAN